MTEKTRLFVLSWDQLGIEGVVDVTEMEERRLEEEKQKVWDILQDKEINDHKGRDNDIGSIVRMMTLRARFNPQRCYEIYSINTTYSVTADEIREMFENDPQASADLVRSRGNQLYSDKGLRQKVVIN